MAPFLHFRYRSIKVWKWGFASKRGGGAVPSDLLFFPGMACSVAPSPGEPVASKICGLNNLILNLDIQILVSAPLLECCLWGRADLSVSLLFFIWHTETGVLPTQHYYNLFQQIRRERVLSFHALDEVGGFSSTSLHSCWGAGACFISQAENKVWPCPCGSCGQTFPEHLLCAW